MKNNTMCNWHVTELFGGYELQFGCCDAELIFGFDNIDNAFNNFKFCPNCSNKITFDQEVKVIKQRYVKEIETGDVGYVVGSIGDYCKAQFKVKGLYGFRSSLIGSSYEWIKKEQYQSIKKEEISMAKAKKKSDEAVSNAKKKLTGKSPATSSTQSSTLKDEIRIALKSIEIDKLEKIAKGLDVDISKYNHLSGGLLKMSVSNKIQASLVKLFESGKLKSKKAVMDKLK